VTSAFRISALPFGLFQPLFALDDEQLRQLGARRYVVDSQPGYPCRVSLEDAAPGETVILTPYSHLDADSPYRARGPVFVREGARQAVPAVNEVPELLRRRPLSIRAYDRDSLMIGADVADGAEFERSVARLFGDPRVAFLHVHFAKPGCYACRVDRG
jgi:hypothetical protein